MCVCVWVYIQYIILYICVCVWFPFPKMDPVHWSFLVTKCRNLEANFYVSRLGWSHVKKKHIAVIWISLGAHPSSWSFAFPLFGPLAWSGVNGRSLPAPVVAKCCSSRDLRDGEFRLTVCDQPCCPSYGTKTLEWKPQPKAIFLASFLHGYCAWCSPFQKTAGQGRDHRR